MGKKFFPGILLCLLVVLLASAPATAQNLGPGAHFCTTIDENWVPVGLNDTFDTNEVSCLFITDKPFGGMQLVLSIYGNDGKAEELLHRETIDVNPDWTGLYLESVPLPGTGRYGFSLASVGGNSLSSGEVTITEKKVDRPMPENNKVEGTTLEGLFNKFKSQVE